MSLNDNSLMPFGKYGPGKGDQRKMCNVPAPYLLWLGDEISQPAPKPATAKHNVLEYIEDNRTVLEGETH